ncbi:MAG: hypothetical protein EOO81_00170 [Oxalobacteraceae bacterium]|nr:MAG: hypothetical protein EOO81_00170 [Oxalobacteraceae bacterium]
MTRTHLRIYLAGFHADAALERTKGISEAKRKRNSYGPEFKAKVGLETVRGVKAINEIALEYGVHSALVGQWKKEILEQAGRLFKGKRRPKPQGTHKSEDRLYSGIGRRKMDLDWLKKNSEL